MNTILVSSTEQSTGKTAISIALATLAQDEGYHVGYMKPKGTRLESAVGKTIDEDPLLARELLDLDAEMHEMEPVVYSPTFIEQVIRGKEDPTELRSKVRERFDEQAADADLMILEGSDALTTGGIARLTDVDLAELLDARVLLVAPYERPGDVDHVLAAARGFGDSLDSVLFNAVGDPNFDQLTTDVVPFLKQRDVDVVGSLPRVQELSGVTIGELADRLGATVLTDDADTDVYVERFIVGAMNSDAALRHFRRMRDAAMITGGDRSDNQTAALEAPGIKCLVLTGGYRPPSAVIGRAESQGVPILLVQSDTRTAIDRAEDVVRSGRTRSPKTVEQMRSLLADGVDVESILESGS
jgi:hypothetical protein